MGGGTLISPRIIPHPPILPGIYAYDCSFSISLLSNTLNSGKLECNSVTCFWKSVLYFGPCLTFTADGWQAACLHCKLFSPFKVMHVGRVSPNCATLLRVSPPPALLPVSSGLSYQTGQKQKKKTKSTACCLHVINVNDPQLGSRSFEEAIVNCTGNFTFWFLSVTDRVNSCGCNRSYSGLSGD